ncbi:MAG TPA: 1-(5-phosphoribosyl)-5-[(5-phosphoribosylamino)methylideneamino]imidazole-4-carboxamide isomerase [bacterium]|nr:1-(5-phosphoribosyl)-5-[(5-phosphoribosylamino)methylideneamino]imidazole-4-carboxamide isomerase [bacterium]
MQLIPAIDIRDGACVRLLQGDPDQQINYASGSPVEVARHFATSGAEKIHVIDLDGAIEGTSLNERVVEEILDAVPVKIELGGGIRSLERMRFWLNLGIGQVILGTVAVTRPELLDAAIREFGAERIIVGIDARDGKVATHGWQSVSAETDVDFARQMIELGVRRFVYTAIETDGMLAGPNLDALERFAESVDATVTASGGIRDLSDIRILQQAGIPRVDSVIVGRAIYEGTLDVAEAVAVLQQE